MSSLECVTNIVCASLFLLNSTEQPAEVAAEEVKQIQEEAKEIVDTPVSEEVTPSESVEAVGESVVAPVEGEAVSEESNGVSNEAVAEANGSSVETNGTNGVVGEEEVSVEGKRKSEVVSGDGEVPDSTEVVKKQKVAEEEAGEEEVAPVVEASA